MGCGASKPPSPRQAKPAPSENDGATLRDAAGGTSRGYWERQKLVASKWTVNSTMSIAKAATENGMPEPPETFFETQDRLVSFFQEQGETKIFDPREARRKHPQPARAACSVRG